MNFDLKAFALYVTKKGIKDPQVLSLLDYAAFLEGKSAGAEQALQEILTQRLEAPEGYTLSAYQKDSQETAIYAGRGTVAGLGYALLSLFGEAGELANKIKKLLRQGYGSNSLAGAVFFAAKDADKMRVHSDSRLHDQAREQIAEMRKELGDMLWYVAAISYELGTNLGLVARHNRAKLKSRQERGTLEGKGDNR